MKQGRVTRFPWTVLLLGMGTMFTAGTSVYLAGKVAPVIADQIGSAPHELGGIFALQQLGLAIGAIFGGLLADRTGHRTTVSLALLLSGGLSLTAVLVGSVSEAMIWRCACGICIGASQAAAMAFVADHVPLHRRGFSLTICIAAYSVGTSAGAIFAVDAEGIGWRAGFYVTGLASLALALAAFLTRTAAEGEAGSRPDQEVAPQGTLKRGIAGSVAMICTVFAITMASATFMGLWMPSFFVELAGVPLAQFAAVSLVAAPGSLAGLIVSGLCMDRFRSGTVVLGFCALEALMLALLAITPFQSLAFPALWLAYAFGQSGIQGCLNGLLPTLASARSRGALFGLAGGSGRLASIASPLLGSFVLTSRLPLHDVFIALAVIPVVSALLILGLKRDGAFSRQPPATAFRP